MKQKVSDYIAEFLVNHGIKHIFTVTGGGAMHLNDSFGHHPSLKCIYNHHEQASAMAAEAYGRYTNTLPLVCVTSGPGGTNTLTGVLGAWLDSTPMFIISGQVKTETTVQSTKLPLRQLGDQEFNIVNVVDKFTKYAHMIINPIEIRYHLEKCLYFALNGRGGPVWLDIPLDIQGSIIDTNELIKFESNNEKIIQSFTYDKNLHNEIISRINNSQKPIIYVGNGVRLSGQYNNFLHLIEILNIPVVTAWNAHDLLPNDHPLYAGRPGTIGTRGGNFVVENADLMLILGTRLNIRQVSYNFKNFAINSYKIMVDIDHAELNKPTIKIDSKIQADLKEFIPNMVNYCKFTKIKKFPNWINWSKKINFKYPVVLDKHKHNLNNVNPYGFIDNLFDRLNENETIVTSNGSACVVTFQAAKIRKYQRLFTNSGCASMGYGLPAAIGCSFSNPNKRVICIEGDGSLQMNIQELQTVIHSQLNIKLIVFNNNGYHSIRQTQTNIFKSSLVGVDENSGISFPNLNKISDAYGIPYFSVQKLSDLENIYSEAFEKVFPTIIEVFVDVNQFFEPKLSSKVLEDGRIISPRIDDMYPFLSREEYESVKFNPDGEE
jgi:acetolactate synthase-1/2/3 large subunit